ncbi:hypothetical protein EDD11_007301 [Mortierella claussenii]|nr:hypothetical protein EDD11_007301 [Mortierella claussenii]
MNILHNYLHGASGLAVHYYDQVLSLEVNPYQSPEIFLERYLSVDLRVQVTWALCSSILETLQSIVLPLKDIDRYLSNVHKFQHLTHVVFKLDEKLTYPDYIYGVMKEDHPNWARLLNDRRDRALSKMVLFVKDHTHLFPRQLKSATCPEDSNWHPQNCPASVHAALQACLSLS